MPNPVTLTSRCRLRSCHRAHTRSVTAPATNSANIIHPADAASITAPSFRHGPRISALVTESGFAGGQQAVAGGCAERPKRHERGQEHHHPGTPRSDPVDAAVAPFVAREPTSSLPLQSPCRPRQPLIAAVSRVLLGHEERPVRAPFVVTSLSPFQSPLSPHEARASSPPGVPFTSTHDYPSLPISRAAYFGAGLRFRRGCHTPGSAEVSSARLRSCCRFISILAHFTWFNQVLNVSRTPLSGVDDLSPTLTGG